MGLRTIFVAMLLCLPVAGATPVTLYGHLSGHQDFPISTMPPPEATYRHTVAMGLATHSMCLEDPTMAQHLTANSHHTWYGYLSPSRIFYEENPEGNPTFYSERGNQADLVFAQSAGIRLEWPLLAQWTKNEVTGPVDAPVAPEIVVRATLRVGDDISVGHSAFNEGQPIAMGEVGPVTLHADVEHEAVRHESTEDGHVYTFLIDMPIELDTVPAGEGFNLRVDAFMDNPYCTDSSKGGYLTPDLVKAYTGPGNRPTLQVDVQDAMNVEYTHITRAGDDLLLQQSATSPFGPYDVDHENTWIRVTGPDGDVPLHLVEKPFIHVHGEPDQPQRTDWLLENVTSLPEGTYNVTFHAENLQGTAVQEAYGHIQVGQDVSYCYPTGAGDVCRTQMTNQQSPGPAWLPALLVAAAFVLMRRRT